MDWFPSLTTSILLAIMVGLVGTTISETGSSGKRSGEELSPSEQEMSRAAHLFNKKTRKLFLKLFRRKIKIPEGSSLSLATQVSRPNIFPGLFLQEDGFITDAVIEFPMWLDLDDFAEAMYTNNKTSGSKSAEFIGIERCFLYEKLEWIIGAVAQLSDEVSHACLLKFICETQAIHSFYPEYPVSVVFELIHLLLTPSFGFEDPCFDEYVVAENNGRIYGRCEKYDSICPFGVGGILIHNFFPVTIEYENNDSNEGQDFGFL